MSEAWSEHSRILATAIINNPTAYEWLAYNAQIKAVEMTQPWADLYKAAGEIYPKANLTAQNLMSVSPAVKKLLDSASYEPVDRGQYEFSANIVRSESSRYRKTIALKSALKKMETGADPEEVSRELTLSLVQDESASMRSPAAKDIVDRSRQRGTPEKRIRTGIAWLDATAGGGIRNRSLVVIGAPEKGRKTTLMRNIVLYMLREMKGSQLVARTDAAVCFMAYENDQDISAADFIAMMAAEYLYYRGMSKEKIGTQSIMSFCTSSVAENYMADEESLKPGKLRDAFYYAWCNFRTLNLEILDRSKQNGGLRTVSDMVSQKRRFAALNTGKHQSLFVDFAQLVTNGGTEYEDLKKFSRTALDMAMEAEGATVFAASQVSREQKRAQSSKTDGDVMGSKGGASLEEDCSMYYTTGYDPDVDEAILRTTMRRSRRGAQGKGQYVDFVIHPQSGLILGTMQTDDHGKVTMVPTLKNFSPQ